MNPLYTNGALAVKERTLLGDKLLRLAEMSAEEAFRALSESGFGSGSEAASSFDAERLCTAEERALDGFIREYAPSRAVREYLLAPRDFHNMKAIVKAKKLGGSPEKLFAPEGLIPVAELARGLEDGQALPALLSGTARTCLEKEDATGAEIGAAFDAALFRYLWGVCRMSGLLKTLLAGRADRLNILTVMRAADKEYAEKLLLPCGKLKKEELFALRDGKLPENAACREFALLCRRAAEKGEPFTAAERALGSFEAEYFAAHRYELEGKEPFLYYVFRRRAEIANVRILLVCLNAGLSERDIKARLRGV